MTMIPAQNRYFDGSFGGCGDSYSHSYALMSRLDIHDNCSEACLGSGSMAEDESRTNSLNEVGSSSRDVLEDSDQGWLRLGIGGQMTSHEARLEPTDSPVGRRRAGLVELDLLTGGGGTSHQVRSLAPLFPSPQRPVTSFISTPLFLQNPGSGSGALFPHLQGPNWSFRHLPTNITAAAAASSSSSSYPFIPPSPYFKVHPGADVAGESSTFRLVEAPRRPHSGLWFMLQASQNQGKEPYLPQIPKSYLRIKDGRMTVRLLIKYLVNKLRLDSESEVEITCRGQQLLPFLTLQHIRDNIWNPRDTVTLLADSSTTDHVMVLNYGRRA